MKVLFVCTANKLRSPTAQSVFESNSALDVKSAGLDADCPNPLTAELVSWAEVIFVMENVQREKIRKKFKDRPADNRIINLNIPDEYERDQPELITLLKDKAGGRIALLLEPRDE